VRLLYKPFGLLAGILGGRLARRLFSAIWGRIDDAEPPGPTVERASWRRVVGAAALQGATFAATRAAVDRAGAKSFAHFFGVWPGKREPDKHESDET
jgi:pectin methylesterase-like acyl-CoA thioesterase